MSGIKLNTWTTLNDEGEFVTLGGDSLKTTLQSQADIEKLTDYKFTPTQTVKSAVNTVKKDISTTAEAIKETGLDIASYAKYIPFALMGVIVIMLVGRK